ncbi:hypothetical protein E2562_027842 [Oryza meyeriana var. granulata]|uniref:Uncharacterized protein n=1 Tax=Oryza meyeriana var. granulata TaxID=110450 RepID=A0A6G1DRI3_9ORYZ|nr:hypothetical protein E2562_027842 [Oryza meyeriana var. granulata]
MHRRLPCDRLLPVLPPATPDPLRRWLLPYLNGSLTTARPASAQGSMRQRRTPCARLLPALPPATPAPPFLLPASAAQAAHGYAKPLVDRIDANNRFRHRLYRPSTVTTV